MPLSPCALPLVLWCIGVFILSSIPGNMYPEVNIVGADKAVHVALYSLGGLLAGMAFYRRNYGWLFGVVFCCLYGVSDEVHQIFVPRRSFSWGDILADATGGLIGVSVFYFLVLPVFRGRVLPEWNENALPNETKGVRST